MSISAMSEVRWFVEEDPSRYQRTLADAAIGNQPKAPRPASTTLHLRKHQLQQSNVRRADQGLTSRYVRSTTLLRGSREKFGPALAEQQDRGWCLPWEFPSDAQPCLRLVRALPDPPTGVVTVLDIDGFALGRQHRCGTVLVDMDTHRPVDVLVDRRACTVAEWLIAHPDAEVICRHPAGTYGTTSRRGGENGCSPSPLPEEEPGTEPE